MKQDCRNLDNLFLMYFLILFVVMDIFNSILYRNENVDSFLISES